ncbi:MULTISPECIES: deoxyribodipyrimidine photo-lyase [unclassified Rhizobium]|uniref:cryptochrome/photolyase family protein n=1 Tax=unclassified Rhizobium TaxID=2613769 RepID=UPI00160A1E68|nr:MULTISPECIES: deoxyribodipyrimidine photo-lyase [unclassified Rhizobium]MBB3320559.1 deoxyribodipyrimidine photo-lyase [Rhizobium sp. BK181]MBB3545526.1 deoxyribodipyrimidine photo-lyase [Rhizobium sp. BK399]MCS3744443.1 deoxyribodipyrimidine photo-lyase [Rhizobium sp. BK661]MCS4096751.1 deoxyribodipyrimidine photo-lyase [Rhizobium sp. BK176]
MATENAKPVILWFRKDLRLDDNRALHAACTSGRPVIPVYIREPRSDGTAPLGAAQDWWLHHSLESMQGALCKLGGSLHLVSGHALDELSDLVAYSGAETVLWNRRYDPAGIAIDTQIKRTLAERGIEARSFPGQLLHDPSKLMTGAGTPYRTYTPFWRALEKLCEPGEPLDPPTKIRFANLPRASELLADWTLLPTRPNWAKEFSDIWIPGEAAAHRRLSDFVEEDLQGYRLNRELPSRQATSQLSPYLALGIISPARVWHETRGLSKRVPVEDLVHFRKELAWREFSYHLLYHFPGLPNTNWNDRMDTFPWENHREHFEIWTKGLTGYPIVDAGMRQLWRHGYMHNRVRMIAASFLIKDLMVDWRLGESWFRDTLIDADPANNAASWQWVAGSGADASPFFRIFNPTLQGEKFDPDGAYVREFVPELANLDNRYIHRPFEAPVDVLAKTGITLGTTYPMPVVNHAFARDRALEAYNATKGAF